MFIKKKILYCEVCEHELNWYESSGDAEYYYCKHCDIFYEAKKEDKVLHQSELPRKRLERIKEMGYKDEGYQGIPTSQFYRSRFEQFIERLFFLKKK